MTRINLLPIKAGRRLEGARRELALIGSLCVFCVLGLGLWYQATESHINELSTKLASAQQAITKLDEAATQIEAFKQQALVLEAKLKSVETLKRSRSGPARMLADIADIFTRQPQVWMTRFNEQDHAVTLQGGAVDQEQVSQLQLALSHDSKFLSNVTLGVVSTLHEGGVEYVQWSMTCALHYDAS
jgi:type IV pilus assembly protein PilN